MKLWGTSLLLKLTLSLLFAMVFSTLGKYLYCEYRLFRRQQAVARSDELLQTRVGKLSKGGNKAPTDVACLLNRVPASIHST